MFVYRQVVQHLSFLTFHLWSLYWNTLCSRMAPMGENFLCSQLLFVNLWLWLGVVGCQLVILGKGFENSLPPNNDVSVRADLRRIKWIRNVMQSNRSKKMSNEDFQQYWDDISGVRLLLNTRTCTPYTKHFIRILKSMKITYFPHNIYHI